jgi:hypothetical protein
MTVSNAGDEVAGSPAPGPEASTGLARPGRDGPIIVLSYRHAGADLLREALAAHPGLACTAGTGILPLCQSALATWQAIEGRNAPPSALAVRSVRALLGGMMTVALARIGGTRWCEVAFAPPEAAEAFLHVFPTATFVCLHRALPSVIDEALRMYPWGLGGSALWGFAGPHPGNNAATIAAYWAANTEPLLDFEDRHPDRTIRARYEDVATDAEQVADLVCNFAGLAGTGQQLQDMPRPPERTAPSSGTAATLPPVPSQVRARIDALTARLEYPADVAAEA